MKIDVTTGYNFYAKIIQAYGIRYMGIKLEIVHDAIFMHFNPITGEKINDFKIISLKNNNEN